ncbi:DUF6461 domain-containing protein [Streptomyces lanatus]|uniref:DUF6461 domain-containing protein n=1 Tax=Streptomyces lanatus TaxID=66900 RepID=A0ABV1XZ04_9ACTN|nr:DUF6461 domain-containing protein [Streptomyces lanatus]GHH19185.1 hypothetical protein GCM10018780_64470 [Streptomyces lanatus]
MTGMTTAADYAWLEERYENLMQAYCVTLVRGPTPQELLRELRAEPRPGITGVDGLAVVRGERRIPALVRGRRHLPAFRATVRRRPRRQRPAYA